MLSLKDDTKKLNKPSLKNVKLLFFVFKCKKLNNCLTITENSTEIFWKIKIINFLHLKATNRRFNLLKIQKSPI